MAKILRNASRKPVSVPETATVLEAVKTMVKERIGAVVVMKGKKMTGIFSERDVLDKIVLARRDPAKTRVSAVMTANVLSIAAPGDDSEAATTMAEHHIRHLPIVDGKKKVVGVVSLRHVMEDRIADLEHEVNVLTAYLGYDGVAG
ncbi:MAG TPA: CBS domain-containing protein [Thermoanaerobaculia bacterium]|nr:CBS domain-containing protein [Thermoanaerobaculia bacterium]